MFNCGDAFPPIAALGPESLVATPSTTFAVTPDLGVGLVLLMEYVPKNRLRYGSYFRFLAPPMQT